MRRPRRHATSHRDRAAPAPARPGPSRPGGSSVALHDVSTAAAALRNPLEAVHASAHHGALAPLEAVHAIDPHGASARLEAENRALRTSLANLERISSQRACWMAQRLEQIGEHDETRRLYAEAL